jgi:hypothetical protein
MSPVMRCACVWACSAQEHQDAREGHGTEQRMEGRDDQEVDETPRQVDKGQQGGTAGECAHGGDVSPDLLGHRANLGSLHLQHEGYERLRESLFDLRRACCMPAHARSLGHAPGGQRQGGCGQQHDQGLAAAAGKHAVVNLQGDERGNQQQQMAHAAGDECADDFRRSRPDSTRLRRRDGAITPRLQRLEMRHCSQCGCTVGSSMFFLHSAP